MSARRQRCWATALLLLLVLTSCASLPPAATEAVLRTFAPEEEASVYSAHRGDLIPEDVAAGAEEVWCVQVSHLCFDCARQQMNTCVSSRVARLIQGVWRVDWLLGSDDVQAWESRGCPEADDVVAVSPGLAP